jgi:hypothetical protein
MKKLFLLTLALLAISGPISLQAQRKMFTPTDNNGKPMITRDRKVICQELIGALHVAAEELQTHVDSYGNCLKSDKLQRVKDLIQEIKSFESQESMHLERMMEHEVSPV